MQGSVLGLILFFLYSDIKDQVNPLLKISYMWFTTVGMLVTILVGAAVSKINQARGKTHIMPAPRLLAPQIRRFCKEPPHPNDDAFISAFSNNKVCNCLNEKLSKFRRMFSMYHAS